MDVLIFLIQQKYNDAEIEAITTQLSEKKFFQTYSDFKNEVTGQAKFYLNIMKCMSYYFFSRELLGKVNGTFTLHR